MRKTHTVALTNLGCRVNRVELDLLATRLEAAGVKIADAAEADVVVLNTCAVTAEAEAKTRKAIRRALALPQRPQVVAMGCVATLFAGELASLGERVVVVGEKERCFDVVADLLGLAGDSSASASGLRATVTPTGRTRPGIKIQDGCDMRCTYCIVWKARGPSRSLEVEQVMAQVAQTLAAGAREVVLTGINLGCYASDGLALPGLLTKILAETDVSRVRLSSIEPPDVTEELLQVMAGSEGRVAPFLHICLQSGSDAVLARMGRTYDTAAFRAICERARAYVPDVALGTDLICGFPAETDAEFAESLAFVAEMRFARMHVFRYSRRPGTPAASFPDQVSAQVASARAARMRALARDMRDAAMAARDGCVERVLVQEPGHATSPHLFDVRVPPDLALGELASVRLAWEGSRLEGTPV